VQQRISKNSELQRTAQMADVLAWLERVSFRDRWRPAGLSLSQGSCIHAIVPHGKFLYQSTGEFQGRALMNADHADGESQPTSTWWGLGLAIVLALVLGFLAFVLGLGASMHFEGHPNPPPRDILVSAVAGSVVVVPVWALLYYSFVRWRRPERGSRHFVILASTVLAVNMAMAGLLILGEKRDAEVQTAAAISGIRTAILHSNSPDSFKLGVQSRSLGDAGILGRATKRYLLSISSDNKVLDQSGPAFDANLWSSNLGVEEKITRSRGVIAAARAVVQSYWTHRAQHLAAFRSEIAASPIDPATRTSALATFDRAARDALPVQTYERSLQTNTFDEFDALLKSAQLIYVLQQSGAPLSQLQAAVIEGKAHLERSRAAMAAYNSYRQGLRAQMQ
jgi:hypothetical protein